MYQPSASGNASRRSVSAVGAQSTTITSHSPRSGVQAKYSRASTSSAPGMTVSSSAATGSTPEASSTERRYRWMSAHDCSKRSWASTCWTQRFSVTGDGSLSRPGGSPNASASEWAASVDSTRVRWPAAAARAAVPAASVDLPTPPLPVKRRTRTGAVGEGLDALLEPFQRGVDEDLLALALDHADQRDRDVQGEPVGDLGRAVAAVERARTRRRARGASCPRPGSRRRLGRRSRCTRGCTRP